MVSLIDSRLVRRVLFGVLLLWTGASSSYTWRAVTHEPPKTKLMSWECRTFKLESPEPRWPTGNPRYAPEVEDALDLVIAYHPDWPTVVGGCTAWLGVEELVAATWVLE